MTTTLRADPAFEHAFRQLIKHEGGKTTDHAGPTNFGITLRSLQATGDAVFDKDFDGDIDKKDLWEMSTADAFYYVYRYWWLPYRIHEIHWPEVAGKTLDLAYNMGPVPAIKIVQRAAARLGHDPGNFDGKLGKRTLTAVAECSPDNLMEEIRQGAREFYQDLVHRHPEYQKYLKGWLNRAAA